MIYIEIKNWKNFQHYKDRNPPWIKLHYELITSHDWVIWDDASKLLAVACMMIASRNEGRIPADESYIQKVAHLQKKPDLNPLIKSGFFVDASALLADASAKTETEAYKQEDNKNVDFDSFYKLYPNKKAPSEAEKSYHRALKVDTHENIMLGLKLYCESVKSSEKKFIAHPATWLNQGRWKDDYGIVSGSIPDWIKAQYGGGNG